MEIWVFGNPDLDEDALPIRILPKLRRMVPQHTFVVKDPLDEWVIPRELYIIDTVKGITRVERFDTLDAFAAAPRVSMHDFDLHTQLAMLDKLGKLPRTVIFGVPPDGTEALVISQLSEGLRRL